MPNFKQKRLGGKGGRGWLLRFQQLELPTFGTPVGTKSDVDFDLVHPKSPALHSIHYPGVHRELVADPRGPGSLAINRYKISTTSMHGANTRPLHSHVSDFPFALHSCS